MLLALTVAATVVGAVPADRKASCDAAIVAFDSLHRGQIADDPKRPTIVSAVQPVNGIALVIDTNRSIAKSTDPHGFLHHDWKEGPMSFADPVPLKQAPQAELLDRAEHADTIAALGACAGFRTYLTKHHVKFGQAAVNAATAGAREVYNVEILRLSLPFVSRDGTEAIAIEDTSASDVEGGESAILLRKRPDGTWYVAGTLSLVS